MGNNEMRKSKNCIILKTRDKKQFNNVMNLRQDVTVNFKNEMVKVVFEKIKSRNESKGIVFEESWKLMNENDIMTEINEEQKKIEEKKGFC